MTGITIGCLEDENQQLEVLSGLEPAWARRWPALRLISESTGEGAVWAAFIEAIALEAPAVAAALPSVPPPDDQVSALFDQIHVVARQDHRLWFDIVAFQAATAIERERLRADFKRAEHRRQEAEALSEIARDLASDLDLDRVLDRIISRASSLFAADLSYIFQVTDDGQELYMRVSTGNQTPDWLEVRSTTREGVFASLAQDRRSFVIPDYLAHPRRVPRWEDVSRREGLRGMMGSPIVAGNRFIGSVHVAYREPKAFTGDDIALLEALAAVAGIAIENARLYTAERQNADSLHEMHAQVAHKKALLERSLAIHDEFTACALEDQGLSAIIRKVADLTTNPALLQDQFGHPLAQADSPPELSAYLCDGSWLRALTDQSVSAGRQPGLPRGPIRMPALPALGVPWPRVAAVVNVGREILGVITVFELQRPLEELDVAALGHAVTSTALELMKQRAIAEAELRMKGDWLEDIFDSRGKEDDIRRRGALLGYDLTGYHRVLLIDVDSSAARTQATNGAVDSPAPWLDTVLRFLQQRCSPAIISRRGARIIALLPALALTLQPRDSSTAWLLEEIRRCCPGLAFTLALGMSSDTLAGIRRSLAEAEQSLIFARAHGRHNGIIAFEELGVFRLLHRVGDGEELRTFAETMVGPILRYDQRRGTQLLATLEAFLSLNGNAQETARRMCLHPHTLKYRLECCARLTNLNLHDGETRFNLQLAIKVLKMMGQASNPARLCE